ncbi:ABC transporter substrate-binding protein [Actinoplanes sp. NPDC049681]|uniref:ABC transporter substrate-binding protein n=1 Tax=Actinoplanes sp. NPDC049681 TaxID=3363905 RepID=UPI0037A6DE1D
MPGRRRGPLSLVLVMLLALLPACGGGGKDDGGAEGSDDKVEVFSWWDGPGEKEGYEALIAYFKRKNPTIEFVNAAVAGGAGINARAVLASRLAAGDPPDSYQIHAGLEQTADIKAGKIEDLSAMYERNGWRKLFPAALLDATTIDGKIYSVPVTIHRSNVLWFNIRTLKSAGITKPPTTWSQFLKTAGRLKARNITPLSIGPGWTQKHLLENVLLGELGPEKYTGLWNGRTSWLGADVRAAVAVFAKVLAASDIKTFGGDWQSALDKMIEGGAAYTVMGDWADAYLGRAKGLKFGTDYGAVASPGTSGVFNFLSDTFTLPKGAPHRDAAEKWLSACASLEGQEALSVKKGSLPARLDTDRTKYHDYLATALAAWQDPATVVVGSATHGVMVDPARSTEIDTALATFVDDGDLDAFVRSLARTYAGYQPTVQGS